jgi:hypothetical protein
MIQVVENRAHFPLEMRQSLYAKPVDMRSLLLILFLALISVSSCGPKIYEAPGATAIAASHRVVAIIPPAVTIQGRRKDDPEDLRRAAEQDTYTFQREIFSWMMRRKQQGRIRGVEFLDVESTNAKLERAGYASDTRILTPQEMAEVLNVDAVITSQFNTTKPMSEGAAVALGALFGVWGNTKETSVNMSIHDAESGLIWNYDWVAGATFASPEALVDALMRNASRRNPYIIR